MDHSSGFHSSLTLRTRDDGARYWRSGELSLPESAAGAPLVLASVSPRRQVLLRRAGVRFRVVNPGEDPALPHLEDWPAACLRAAHKAARGAVARPGRVALGADTVVVYGRHTLGKPRDGEDAERMLEMLSGAEHFVYTAFCLALGSTGFQACVRRRARNAGLEACATRKGGRARKPAPRGGVRMLWLEVVRTRVRFRGLGPEEICDYVASGAPFDKAGGYGIQDRGAGLVEQIAGSYYNVVGLPVREVGAALRRVGWHGSAGARGRAA